MDQHILFGRQLMFDEFTNDIVEEPIRYWKTMQDVPEHIKSFILDTVSTRVIYDSSTNKYHCARCLKELDEHYYCSVCSKQCKVPTREESKYIIHSNIKDIKEYSEHTRFFVFDVINYEVLIYIFDVYTCYRNPMSFTPYQTNRIIIDEIYHVTKDDVTNLLTEENIVFDEYGKDMDDDYNYDLLNIFDFVGDNSYLYTDNLDMLRNTPLYKHTSIWKLKEYFENNSLCLATLTYNPICCKQFEYLVKMKLYNLAARSPKLVEYKHTFKDTFGVDKKYYSFMKDIDIDCDQLHALRLCPTTDIDLINFISRDTYLFEELSKYVKADKIKVYLEKQKLDYHNIYEYYDYIRCCEHMSLDIKDKQILFPKDFIKQHDKITSEMVIAADPKTNERIQSLSNILALNRYEDDRYIIFPADSVDSLIDESSQMSNCVRNYCLDVSNNVCQIYFMRYKDKVDKSLVTIEVRDGKIVQARTRFNELPTDEINEVLRKWEKNIIPIRNSY